MIEKLTQAKRLVEAFIALMVGRSARIHWDTRGSMDSEGGIHLPPPKTGDAAEIALLTRLAVHEGGHLLQTEQGFADRLSRDELTIFNCLEDPRMEGRQVQRFPGASLVLSRGLDEMLQGIEDRLDETLAAMPERAVHLDMLLRGFLAVAPHGPFARRGPAMLQRIAAHLDESQRTAIDETVARLPELTTSLDAEEAARRFLARLRELETPPQQGDQDQQDQQQDEQQQDQLQDEATPDGGGAGDGPQPPSDEQEPGGAGAPPPEGSDAQDGQDGTADQREPSNGAEANGNQRSGEPGGGSEAADGEPSGDEQANGAGKEPPQASQQSGPQDGQAGEGQPSDSGSDAGNPAGGAGNAQSKGGSESSSAASADTPAPAEQQQASQGGQGGSQPPQAADGFDLGQLLRDAHVARYGASDVAEETAAANEGSAELAEEELQRVAALLAQADPAGPLEDLVEASLVALAAAGESEDGDTPVEAASSGAGMSLATAPTGPVVQLETRLQGVQSRLVTVLQRELQDKRRRPTRSAYAGRVMPQRFWRLGAMGDTKVFVHRQPAAGIDAAATVLLDSSDSMDEQLTVAAEVTMAFSLALQRLGVRTRVARFPGTETVTETIQRFGESARACVHRCAELEASGGTPIGAAVALETPALIQQRRLKNVLAVVTDDAPGDKPTLAAALERANELDILVVGVGIGCDIRMWIPHSVSVQSVNELPDALARLFRENITEKLAA